MQGTDAIHQTVEHRRRQGFVCVTECFFRFGMDFDYQAVTAGCNGCHAHGFYQAETTGAVRRVNDNGKMGQFFYRGNGTEVKGVSGIFFKCPDTSLTKNDVRIPLTQNIFGTV